MRRKQPIFICIGAFVFGAMGLFLYRFAKVPGFTDTIGYDHSPIISYRLFLQNTQDRFIANEVIREPTPAARTASRRVYPMLSVPRDGVNPNYRHHLRADNGRPASALADKDFRS